jgi:hypothetical protein
VFVRKLSKFTFEKAGSAHYFDCPKIIFSQSIVQNRTFYTFAKRFHLDVFGYVKATVTTEITAKAFPAADSVDPLGGTSFVGDGRTDKTRVGRESRTGRRER